MNFAPMNYKVNKVVSKEEAGDLLDREGHDVQSCLLASQETLALAEKLRFWVAQRFNAAIRPPFSAWASAPEVLSLGFLANRLAAAVGPQLFSERLLSRHSNHRANQKMLAPMPTFSICEPTMNPHCGKSNPHPSIKPVIAGDTTYGVSLLTATISGSNFAIP
jgi:hypothetical protein